MQLGDMFWIKLYEIKKDDYRYKDTMFLQEFIKKEFGYDLSFLESLQLWEYVSGTQSAGWLDITTFNDDELYEMIDWVFKGE